MRRRPTRRGAPPRGWTVVAELWSNEVAELVHRPAPMRRSAVYVRAVLSISATVLMPTSSSGQEVIRIDDQVACEECAVDLRLEVTLAPPPEQAGFVQLPLLSVARDSDRYYFTGPMVGETVITIFQPSGVFHGVYGRVGQGPSEFTGPPGSMMIRVGESNILYVLEGLYLHVLSAKATRPLSLKRRVNLRPNDAVILGTTPVLQSSVHAPRGGGTPMQILADDGTIQSGIGITSARPLSASAPFDAMRSIGRANRGQGVWSAYLNRFEMSRFDLQGREEVRVVRDSDWFPAYDNLVRGEMFVVPQRPRITGILEAADGRLWVAIAHADEHFEPLIPQLGTAETPLPAEFDFNRLLDTTIEVLDLVQGRVVARQRFDSYLRFVSTPNDEVLLYALREQESLELVVDVFEGTVRVP